MVRSALELKIIACYGKLKPVAIADALGIKVSKVYSTLRKFGKPIKDNCPITQRSNGTFEPYGRTQPKKRSTSSKRICKPYKTSQLR